MEKRDNEMKNVFVTGAAQGIGYWFAEQLLRDGWNVTILDKDIAPLEALEKQYPERLLAICGDVRDGEVVREAVLKSAERFGGVDCAVHNACRCTFDAMEDTPDEVYRDVLDVNYFGALNLTRAAVPVLKQQGGGRVIFTSSGVGVTGFVNISPYASSKGAIEALAKCMRIEYAKDNITFHIFHPPLTRTASASPLPVPKEFMADPQKVGRGLARHIGGKRFILCHSLSQKVQTLLCYLAPIRMGRMMSMMTQRYMDSQKQ